MEVGWNDILFFPEDDPEALKTAFVELWAIHPLRQPYEIAQYVFRNSREPELRAGKAAQIWSVDLDVLERIRILRLKGPEVQDSGQNDIERRALQLADNPQVEAKDRIAALTLVAKMKGYIKKEIETPSAGGGTDNKGDFLSELAKRLPA